MRARTLFEAYHVTNPFPHLRDRTAVYVGFAECANIRQDVATMTTVKRWFEDGFELAAQRKPDGRLHPYSGEAVFLRADA